MRRVAAIGIGLTLCTLAAALVWMQRDPATPPGPERIAVGETVEQVLPGDDGKPEVWKLHKREVEREALQAELLPRGDPQVRRPQTGNESARALDAQALEAWKTGQLREALALFEAAIAADPDDWLPRANFGRLLVMMADHARAAPQLERAAALNPDSARVWLDLYSHYQGSLQLGRAFLARERAESLASGAAIVQDETGLWRLANDSILP